MHIDTQIQSCLAYFCPFSLILSPGGKFTLYGQVNTAVYWIVAPIYLHVPFCYFTLTFRSPYCTFLHLIYLGSFVEMKRIKFVFAFFPCPNLLPSLSPIDLMIQSQSVLHIIQVLANIPTYEREQPFPFKVMIRVQAST